MAIHLAQTDGEGDIFTQVDTEDETELRVLFDFFGFNFM